DLRPEVVAMPVHRLHAVAHLQDGSDAADVHAEVAGKIEDEFEALQVLVGIETRVAFGAGGVEQTLALIETQSLTMDAVHFCNSRNHVGAFGAAFGHCRKFITVTTEGTAEHRRKFPRGPCAV